MKNPKLSSRYAQALYDFSIEMNQEEEVYRGILAVHKLMKENQEMKTVLESPIITQDKKLKIIKAVFHNRVCGIACNFITLIVSKRRTPQLQMICQQLVKIYYKNHNIKEVYITTAYPLSKKMAHYLKIYLEKDSPYTFVFHLSVNPALIGGIIVKVDDFYFDAGILSKINRLKAEFSQNDYAAGF
jgi:F-type H+-transporting ATPase subunit delta